MLRNDNPKIIAKFTRPADPSIYRNPEFLPAGKDSGAVPVYAWSESGHPLVMDQLGHLQRPDIFEDFEGIDGVPAVK